MIQDGSGGAPPIRIHLRPLSNPTRSCHGPCIVLSGFFPLRLSFLFSPNPSITRTSRAPPLSSQTRTLRRGNLNFKSKVILRSPPLPHQVRIESFRSLPLRFSFDLRIESRVLVLCFGLQWGRLGGVLRSLVRPFPSSSFHVGAHRHPPQRRRRPRRRRSPIARSGVESHIPILSCLCFNILASLFVIVIVIVVD